MADLDSTCDIKNIDLDKDPEELYKLCKDDDDIGILLDRLYDASNFKSYEAILVHMYEETGSPSGKLIKYYYDIRDCENMFKYGYIGTSQDKYYAYLILGDFFASIGDYKNAKKYYKRSITLSDKNFGITNIAKMYLDINDKVKALKYLKKGTILGLCNCVKYLVKNYRMLKMAVCDVTELLYESLDEKIIPKCAYWLAENARNEEDINRLSEKIKDDKTLYNTCMAIYYKTRDIEKCADFFSDIDVKQGKNILDYISKHNNFDVLVPIYIKLYKYLPVGPRKKLCKYMVPVIKYSNTWKSITDPEKKNCVICTETKIMYELPCKHELCIDCYGKVKDICPFCKAQF